MRVRILLLILLFICIYPARGDSRFTFTETQINDYVLRQSGAEDQIRNRILKLTPRGTSPAKTLAVIKDLLGQSSPLGYKKNFYTASPEPPNQLIYIPGDIGILYEHSSWWASLFGDKYIVVWYFDDQDRLFNVTVQKQMTFL
jgi:hypothetical protein